MPAELSHTDRCRLRAEEYRAVAEAMHEAAARASFAKLAAQFEQAAAESRPAKESPATAEGCRMRAIECLRLANGLASESGRRAVIGVARQWMRLARAAYQGAVSTVTVERIDTGQQVEVLVGEDEQLLDWPLALGSISFQRLQRIARGGKDRYGEFALATSSNQPSALRQQGPIDQQGEAGDKH